MNHENKLNQSNIIKVVGTALMFLGVAGFVCYGATTNRAIDANVLYFAFVAMMGWFITQLKSWARKAIIIAFSIEAIGEFIGIIISFNFSLHLAVPVTVLVLRIARVLFYSFFVVLLSRKSIKNQFVSFPNENSVKLN